jgi:hypothetical protein
MRTPLSSAWTFCACSSDIAATSCAVAAVGARPACGAAPERCVAAVCCRPVVVVRAPEPEGCVPEPDSCDCSLDDERELLAVCVVPVLCPSACVCVPDCDEDVLVELELLVELSLGAEAVLVDEAAVSVVVLDVLVDIVDEDVSLGIDVALVEEAVVVEALPVSLGAVLGADAI